MPTEHSNTAHSYSLIHIAHFIHLTLLGVILFQCFIQSIVAHMYACLHCNFMYTHCMRSSICSWVGKQTPQWNRHLIYDDKK